MSTAMNNNLPPHNRDAEEATLGAIIIDPEALFEIADLLTPADFYIIHHGWIYETILELNRRHENIDFITITAALTKQNRLEDCGGEPFIISLINTVPTSMNVTSYARIVHEDALRRRALAAASHIAKLAYDTEKDIMSQLDLAETALLGVRAAEAGRGIEAPSQYATDYLQELETRGDEMPGLATGFTDLDRLLNGLQAPHQYILAARPGMGKSLLALNIADHAVRAGKRVLFFSLEMSVRQIMDRRVSAVTGIDSRRLGRFGELGEGEKGEVRAAVGALSRQPLFIDATENLTPAKIRAKAIRQSAQHGLDLVIIDHFHLMQPDRRLTRADLEYGEMSWALAGLGKTLGVPVLTLSQLNRGVENRGDKRPSLVDLRESGRIEENAYAVMFLYRDGYYDDLADPRHTELIIAKHREGPTGKVNLYFMPEKGRFGNAVMKEVLL